MPPLGRPPPQALLQARLPIFLTLLTPHLRVRPVRARTSAALPSGPCKIEIPEGGGTFPTLIAFAPCCWSLLPDGCPHSLLEAAPLPPWAPPWRQRLEGVRLQLQEQPGGGVCALSRAGTVAGTGTSRAWGCCDPPLPGWVACSLPGRPRASGTGWLSPAARPACRRQVEAPVLCPKPRAQRHG